MDQQTHLYFKKQACANKMEALSLQIKMIEQQLLFFRVERLKLMGMFKEESDKKQQIADEILKLEGDALKQG